MTFLSRIALVLPVLTMVGSASVLAQSEERSVYASVMDKADAPVSGLQAREFIIREDGQAREVLRVGPATEPMQIALLVDTSEAVDSYVLDLRQAVTAFLKDMQGKGEIALVAFGERPTVLVDYTTDQARLQAGVSRIFAARGSGGYLLDAIIDASRAFEKRKAARPVIVAIVGNGQEFSERGHQVVLDELKESGAALHTLAINRRGVEYNDSAAHELELTLSNGTSLTGGRRDDLLTSMGLSDRLRSLARELNSQYRVVYARTRTLLPPKAIEVEVKRPGSIVRARREP